MILPPSFCLGHFFCARHPVCPGCIAVTPLACGASLGRRGSRGRFLATKLPNRQNYDRPPSSHWPSCRPLECGHSLPLSPFGLLWPALARTAAKEGKEGDIGESGNKWPHSKGQANRTSRIYSAITGGPRFCPVDDSASVVLGTTSPAFPDSIAHSPSNGGQSSNPSGDCGGPLGTKWSDFRNLQQAAILASAFLYSRFRRVGRRVGQISNSPVAQRPVAPSFLAAGRRTAQTADSTTSQTYMLPHSVRSCKQWSGRFSRKQRRTRGRRVPARAPLDAMHGEGDPANCPSCQNEIRRKIRSHRVTLRHLRSQACRCPVLADTAYRLGFTLNTANSARAPIASRSILPGSGTGSGVGSCDSAACQSADTATDRAVSIANSVRPGDSIPTLGVVPHALDATEPHGCSVSCTREPHTKTVAPRRRSSGGATSVKFSVTTVSGTSSDNKRLPQIASNPIVSIFGALPSGRTDDRHLCGGVRRYSLVR